MNDELETLRRVRESAPPPDPAVRAAAQAPWQGNLTDTNSFGDRRNSGFAWRAAVAATAVVALAIGSAIFIRQRIDSVKPRHLVAVTSLPQVAADEPAVFLFVGSDSRAFVEDADRSHFGDPITNSGSRADTVMLVRVEPRTGRVLVVSVPRDLFVTIPGCGVHRIAETFGTDLDCGGRRGGTQLLVDTIKSELGVAVNHVIQVEFPQFAALVDQLGGLRIGFPAPARDVTTGLDEPAGCNTLTGDEALAYVRSRHYEWFDGTWHVDPTSDLGRMARQRYALHQLAVAAESHLGADPRPLLRTLFDHVSVDPGFTADDALRFASALRENHSDSALALPAKAAFHGSQSGLELVPEARPVLEALSNGSAPGPAAPTLDTSPGSFSSASSGC